MLVWTSASSFDKGLENDKVNKDESLLEKVLCHLSLSVCASAAKIVGKMTHFFMTYDSTPFSCLMSLSVTCILLTDLKNE